MHLEPKWLWITGGGGCGAAAGLVPALALLLLLLLLVRLLLLLLLRLLPSLRCWWSASSQLAMEALQPMPNHKSWDQYQTHGKS